MAFVTDIHTNPLSAATAGEARQIDAVILGLAGLKVDAAMAADALPQTLGHVPMAHILRASLYLMAAEGAALPELRASLAAADAVAPAATERERMHLCALGHWAAGDFSAARGVYAQLTAAFPRDLLALQVGQQVDFFTGAQGSLRDRIAAAVPHWGLGMPGRGNVLGMLAFGLEETGDYGTAEDVGHCAVAIDPTDSWAVHAVAHVFEMQGRSGEGIAWLADSSDEWAPGNILACHNWWHLALFHMENRDWDRVLALYDAHIARGPGAPALELVDAAALLWRLHLAGVESGDRAGVVADGWAQVVAAPPGPGFYAFNDVHAAFAHVAAGRLGWIERLLAAMEIRADDGGSHAATVGEVGIPLVRAVHALGAGNPAAALDLLERVQGSAMRAGGSNAQRDVFAQMLIAAAEQSGDARAMEAAAQARLQGKPGSPFASAAVGRAQALRLAQAA